jgi:hypothetical protein
MDSIAKDELGYQIEVLTRFPLPRKNVGNEYKKEVNRLTCRYYSPLGIPYTSVHKRALEVVTTKAVCENDNGVILFAGVSKFLTGYGMASNGGKTGYIKTIKDAMEKIYTLTMYITEEISTERFSGVKGKTLSIASDYQILWANGRTDLAKPELFDNLNYMQLTPDFMNLAKNAAPHIQADYMKIRSALTQDVYPWMISKLFCLKDKDQLIKWSWLYSQFNDTKLNDWQMKNFRRTFKESVDEVGEKYYRDANYEFTNEGLILKKSPLLIEPDSKKAGFTVFG